ncbi:sodium/calcium exchanger 1b, partial [Tachysurus ichikawai]
MVGQMGLSSEKRSKDKTCWEEVKDVEQEEAEPLTGEDEEERRIAEMGKPTLGEHVKLEVIIEESYEFKNTVDKLIKKTNLALLVGTNSWRDQFIEAITVSA